MFSESYENVDGKVLDMFLWKAFLTFSVHLVGLSPGKLCYGHKIQLHEINKKYISCIGPTRTPSNTFTECL